MSGGRDGKRERGRGGGREGERGREGRKAPMETTFSPSLSQVDFTP